MSINNYIYKFWFWNILYKNAFDELVFIWFISLEHENIYDIEKGDFISVEK